jgi:hypothetical protein
MSFSITSSEPALKMRRYAITAIALAGAWLAATMAANFLIDPQDVFGTHLIRTHLDANARYAAWRDYQAAPERYDAALFGSSRGSMFDRALLAQQLGVQAVARFSLPFGLMTDHLPALEFLLRDKAARGERLKAVFLVLDADLFGTAPWTNLNIDSFLPPQLSGESRFRFWWRYLTAFQPKQWRIDLLGLADAAPAGQRRPEALRIRLAAAGLVPPPLWRIAQVLAPVANTSVEETSGPQSRPDLVHQLALLTRFVALCRAHEVRLIVAFSPLNRQNVRDDQAPDNARVVDAVARLTPVWDFDRPAWLSARADLWLDVSHYSTAVATMMTQRIFGTPTSAPADFGRLRGP